MQPQNRQRLYFPELDGLRFIAFLLVFIHNSPYLGSGKMWMALNEYGWVGVDLFFCLSAFLITRLLLVEHREKGFINVRYFYIRRILRIFPLYFAYIAFASIYSSQTTGWDTGFPKQIGGLLTFTFNFVCIFLFPHLAVPFIHLWTISYEEQFYAVIPWGLKRLAVIPESLQWRVLAFLFLLGSVARGVFIHYQIKHPAIYMLPITRFESIVFGIAIGLGLFDTLLSRVPGWVLFLSGLLMTANVLLLPGVYNTGWSLMITYPLIGAGMASILFSVVRDNNSFYSKLIQNRVFIYLGKISYGLYIFHIITNIICTQIIANMPSLIPEPLVNSRIVIFAIRLLLTILFSMLSYHLLEKPFLELKEKFSPIKYRPA